jgi:hypothetical protein
MRAPIVSLNGILEDLPIPKLDAFTVALAARITDSKVAADWNENLVCPTGQDSSTLAAGIELPGLMPHSPIFERVDDLLEKLVIVGWVQAIE